MTQRLKGFVVTFDRDLREDDAETLRQAIGLMRGVAAVDPVPSNVDDHINQMRARRELGEKLLNVVYEKDKP